MRTIQAPLEPLLDIRCELGESPIYDAENETLHFLDIARCEVHHYHLPTKEHTVDFYDAEISCIRLRADHPGFIAAAPQGFAFLPARAPSSSPNSRASIPYQIRARNSSATTAQMFNDGEVDPQGRFIAGTKIKRGLPIERGKKEGTLFRVGTGQEAETVLEGLALPNGIAFTADSKTAYITDTLTSEIWRFSYSADGKLSDRHLFVDTRAEKAGLPDGLTVDSDVSGRAVRCFAGASPHDNEDHVWSAKFRGGKITRYTPAGVADLEIVFSNARNITDIEFGGKDASTLFVTTAAVSESGETQLAEQYPRSGAVWAIDLSAEGISGPSRGRFVGEGTGGGKL